MRTLVEFFIGIMQIYFLALQNEKNIFQHIKMGLSLHLQQGTNFTQKSTSVFFVFTYSKSFLSKHINPSKNLLRKNNFSC